jgi:hypothetical protein
MVSIVLRHNVRRSVVTSEGQNAVGDDEDAELEAGAEELACETALTTARRELLSA